MTDSRAASAAPERPVTGLQPPTGAEDDKLRDSRAEIAARGMRIVPDLRPSFGIMETPENVKG